MQKSSSQFRYSFAAAARRARAFARDRRGGVAVEFSIVVVPFLLLLFAIFELAIYFMVATTVENATNNAARMIRTGQMQQGTNTVQAFKDSVCANMSWLSSQCQANLSVDVRTLSQFNNPNAPDPVQNGAFNSANLTFTPGNPKDIVLVRTFFKWRLLTSAMTNALKSIDDNGGTAVITSTAIFRNEPYS